MTSDNSPATGLREHDLQQLVATQQDTIDDLVAAMAVMQRNLATLNQRMAALERTQPAPVTFQDAERTTGEAGSAGTAEQDLPDPGK